jgi:hypothetical protein
MAPKGDPSRHLGIARLQLTGSWVVLIPFTEQLLQPVLSPGALSSNGMES